jgi:uncharacterized membrane protein
MNKKFIMGVFSAVAVSMAIVIVPWAYTFYNSAFSTDPASWGVFGDYFGGVLSTIVSIFGFVAVIVTIKKQSDSIQAQLASIELDKETRDDEVYNRQALQCLEEALTILNDPETGRILKDRVAWLETARLILTAKQLSGRITSESMRTVYAASEKVIRSKFMAKLDQNNCPETIQPEFFSGPDEGKPYKKVSKQLEKRSVYVVYKFASWPREENDLIDDVEQDFSIDPVHRAYFGASEYLKDKKQ